MSQQPPPPQQPSASLSAASPSAASSPSLDFGQQHQQQLRQPPPSRSQQCPQPQSSTATHDYSTIVSAASLADISLQSGNNNMANRSGGGDGRHAMMTRHPNHIDVVDIVEQSKLPDNIITATAATVDPVKREETPFSLKHFLRRNPFTTTSAVTSTITTPPTSSSAAPAPVTHTTAADAATSLPLHRSTGARPKIPSNSATSMYSNVSSAATASPAVPTSASAYDTTSAGTARMKRSPKFSSFDSQASLAEFSTSTSSPSCTSLPANVATSTGATNTLAAAAASPGGGGNFGTGGSYRQLYGSTSHYTSASGASSSALLGDSDHDHVIVSPSSPSGGGGVAFQRSFSTYDIGGGGRRYNVGHVSGSSSRHRAGDAFARATSMQGQQIIHDDDANDDDEEDGLGADYSFLDSPTHRALRAGTAAGILSPDISAALPDFVQDHILVEHMYGANSSGAGSGPMSGRDATESGRDELRYHRQSRHHQQLPDFTQNAAVRGGSLASSLARGTTEPPSTSSAAIRSHGSATGNMPFDLMCSPGGGCEAASAAAAAATQQRRRMPPNLPLDLPAVGVIGSGRQRTAIYHDIPLDLTARNDCGPMQVGAINGNGDIGGVGVEYVDLVEPGAVRTLPDFLADGHVHASAAANGNAGCNSSAVSAGAVSSAVSSGVPAGADALFSGVPSVDEMLRRENSRLRNDLAHSQQALTAQLRRCDELTAAADAEQSRNQRQHERSARQQADAEPPQDAAMVAALRRQVKDLTEQIEVLRKENAILKEEGAVGGATTHSTASSPQPIGVNRIIVQSSHELSRDMRLAAATAENNLRQLLSGVDNLRLMASRIESLADLAIVDMDAATTPSSASGGNAAAGHDYDD